MRLFALALRPPLADLTVASAQMATPDSDTARRRACIERSDAAACLRASLRRSGSIARRNARSRAFVTTTADIIELAWQCGRYGYRKVAELPAPGGLDNQRRAGREYWQREGLKVRHKQPKRGRLWLAFNAYWPFALYEAAVLAASAAGSPPQQRPRPQAPGGLREFEGVPRGGWPSAA
jgi:hypothetical protein